MNFKDYFKQRLMEANFTFPGIFPYQASPDGVGLFLIEPQPPTNINPVGPVPAKPQLPLVPPELPPGTPLRPPVPRDPNGKPLPGSFGLMPDIIMPDGSIQYKWVWVLPDGTLLYWHPDEYWVTPGGYPLGPGIEPPTIT